MAWHGADKVLDTGKLRLLLAATFSGYLTERQLLVHPVSVR